MMAINFGKINCDKFDQTKINRENKVVVFPAGKATQTFLNFNTGLKVDYLCDNSTLLFGERVKGIEIILPVRLREMGGDYTIIITSPYLFAPFISQLETLEILDRCEIVLHQTQPAVVRKFLDSFNFIDRRVKSDKMLLVLAGYKPMLWEIVFKRIRVFAPEDIDVCVVTAGKNVLELDKMCEKNGWSYLATSTNNCCLAQNIAIELFDTAEWIYKLDEDMFICDGYFSQLHETFIEAEKSRYHVGMVAPLIPVNPHGNIMFLEKLGLLDEYESKFGKAFYDFETHFEYKFEETMFFWEHTLPIDETAKKFQSNERAYSIAPHRFSIGAILFRKAVWEEMGGFSVFQGNGVGDDETDFATHFLAKTNFYTYIVSENTFAAHYSFGKMRNSKLLDDFYHLRYRDFDVKGM
ncbi:MAG: hypothetical protein LBU43_06180 [Candidatus Accumulibacter sp.]|jgi:hypothetical protein|nr:hypothetical protein [Accumulibacter sp.]